MKHFQFSAKAALGYIRVCRPGSVIGPQQNYIIQQEARMHQLGARMQKVRQTCYKADEPFNPQFQLSPTA